ncbi:SurA N-terminal domain-containing protein [Wolbachia endosymbiont of Chironomus riparius]|uniref:SurA N-terminal domain-containing protein n=1 Tax=Wolbachia endosymbiont of Chironomus riparius TaxID=2883238 RepID=UPI0020A10D6C|nr:SurA N-terminal domain-containing protein [Wolbachia endosymbiont of Chironomus riparius]
MSTKNLFTKAIAVFLAFSLIFVGISSILSDSDKEEIIAKVGKEIISLNEYKSLYQNYINNTSSGEVQKKLKYDLLNALIEQKLLLNVTRDLGLEIGEESIKDHIKNTKYFQSDKGEFDKERFNEMLKGLHMTEKQYVSKLKKTLPAIMFMNSLFKDDYPITFGEKIDDQIYKNRYQTRVVDIIKITKDAVTGIPEADNQSLLDLYEKNQSNFHYPEYRTAQYIYLDSKYFAGQIEVLDEEIDKIIEQKALMDQIDIFNLIFSTKEEAEKIKKALMENTVSFEQVISGKKLEEIKINNISKDFLPKGMKEEVFNLKEGEISEVLASNFGWHLIRVESIHKILDSDLRKLRDDVKSLLINQKIFERASDFINQANYKIYNGMDIEEISKEYNLPIQNIGPVNSHGKDKDDNKIKDSDDLVSLMFSWKKEQKSYFKSINNSIVSVKVIDIIPSKLQSFEESKLSVLEVWRDKFIAKKMLEIGNNIAEQLKDTQNIEKPKGVELIAQQKIHRSAIDQQDYPFSFIEEVFNFKTIGEVTTPIEHNSEVIIGTLKEMYSSDGKLNNLEIGKRTMIALKEQLIQYLESKYKVEINHYIIDDI